MNHNKKRNTAFLFESLVKELTKASLKNQKEEAKKIASIIKEFFSKSGVLHKELGYYKEIYESKRLPSKIAQKVFSKVVDEYEKLDKKEIFNEQTKLINKVNKKIGKGAYENFVPNYKSLASIYQIFNIDMPIKSKVLLEEKIVRSMSRAAEDKLEEGAKITNATLKIFSKKFNETYKELFVEQKELLEHYVSSFEDNGLKLKIYLNEELARIKNKINNYMESDEVSEQEIMKNKLLEVLELIDGYKNQYITKEILEQILKLQTMVKEIENNE
jgi:hypothetical protein|tara:strand:- start:582 stop:1400 length:819 start_codon:yes stop_codon:yes gene_type:complete